MRCVGADCVDLLVLREVYCEQSLKNIDGACAFLHNWSWKYLIIAYTLADLPQSIQNVFKLADIGRREPIRVRCQQLCRIFDFGNLVRVGVRAEDQLCAGSQVVAAGRHYMRDKHFESALVFRDIMLGNAFGKFGIRWEFVALPVILHPFENGQLFGNVASHLVIGACAHFPRTFCLFCLFLHSILWLDVWNVFASPAARGQEAEKPSTLFLLGCRLRKLDVRGLFLARQLESFANFFVNIPRHRVDRFDNIAEPFGLVILPILEFFPG